VTRAAVVVRSFQGDAPFQRLDRHRPIILQGHPLLAFRTAGASLRIIALALSKQQWDQLTHQQPPLLARL
jgi:hypothetical protein